MMENAGSAWPTPSTIMKKIWNVLVGAIGGQNIDERIMVGHRHDHKHVGEQTPQNHNKEKHDKQWAGRLAS